MTRRRCLALIAGAALLLASLAAAATGTPAATGLIAIKMHGPGGGVISSFPPGIGCRSGATASGCRARFREGVSIVLVARTRVGSVGSWRCPPGGKLRKTSQKSGSTCRVRIKGDTTITVTMAWSTAAGQGGSTSSQGLTLRGFAALPQLGGPSLPSVPATLTKSGGTISDCRGADASAGAWLIVATTFHGPSTAIYGTLTAPDGTKRSLRFASIAAPAAAVIAAEGSGPPVIKANGLYKIDAIKSVTVSGSTPISVTGSVTVSCF